MLALLFVAMLVLMVLGVDLGIAMGLAALLYVLVQALSGSLLTLTILPQKMVNGVDSFPLLAVPLFMLAGELMNRGGITQRLVRFATAVVGHITGGLANVVVVTNMIMAGMSGSAVADAAATGAVLVPAMRAAGYPRRFAAAVVGAASTLGPIIPPSIPMILIGSMVEVSVGRMFLGGAVPGLLIGLALMVVIRIIATRQGFPVEPRPSRRALLVSGRDAVLALAMPVIVIGGILSGATTPTEAAALAVWYAFLLGAVVYREIHLADLPEVLVSVAVKSGAVMLTVATATVFGWIATSERMGPLLTRWVLSLTSSPILILFLIMIVLLALGCLMEPIPILVLMTPILFPVVTAIGIDPVHFGVLVTINVTVGMLTPPVGLTLFLMSAISGDSVLDIARATLPFLAVLLVALFALSWLPSLVVWLPNLVMGVAR
ncbi:MAG: TRAP transporter large permease [Gemmatimonadales bacterium]|nr:TRAP transporter large permease [Gemmatimonadales bacterium]